MGDAPQAFRAAILAALGHAPDVIEPGRMLRFSTNGRRGDGAGRCKLFHDQLGGVYGCYRHGVSEKWCAIDRSAMTWQQRKSMTRQVMAATAERQADQQRAWARNAERIANLWSECQPLTPGDPASQYLKLRGFGGVWLPPPCLRLHCALPYWHERKKLGTFAAMVAPIVAPDGRTVALHRTHLTAGGSKADVPSVRKVTAAAGPLAGACIQLFKPVRGAIGIAEGIETALAAWCASSVPTMAAYSAGNLAAWKWPPGVQRIVIFADHDKSGAEAAEKLRQRALAAGLRCSVMTPADEGADWADIWAQRSAALGAVPS